MGWLQTTATTKDDGTMRGVNAFPIFPSAGCFTASRRPTMDHAPRVPGGSRGAFRCLAAGSGKKSGVPRDFSVNARRLPGIFWGVRDDRKEIQQFGSLLIDHQELIRSYIITQIPAGLEVRDVLQEVNMMLWEKQKSFRLGTNFGAWACTVARYKVLEHRRKEARRRGFLVFSDELSHLLAAEAQEREPEALEEKRWALNQCLEKLSPANRRLLRARYDSCGGELARLSAETGRSNESLRVTLSRIRSSVRRCIRGLLSLEGGIP
jgi:RNA polymerase sigma-70 factor (ECF subfamily)